MKTYNKLVRDLVPARIKADGKHVVWHRADLAELHDKLGFKILEEITEFATAKNPEELIDVIEIVNKAELHGKHGRPSPDVIAEWIGEPRKDLDDDGDVLLDTVFALNDAATEYVVSRSDKAFGELVIALETVIKTTGFERNTLEILRKKKPETNGGFEHDLILDSVAETA